MGGQTDILNRTERGYPVYEAKKMKYGSQGANSRAI